MRPINLLRARMKPKRHILVTSALPYANGPIHLGHLVEYIQTDIWARFQRLRGNTCYYVCADDAHGTPIMLRARAEGIEAEELIAKVWTEHTEDFAGFSIGFDNYHSTHSEENRVCATTIYERNRDAGHIVRRTISQAYDPVANSWSARAPMPTGRYNLAAAAVDRVQRRPPGQHPRKAMKRSLTPGCRRLRPAAEPDR